MEQSVPLAQGFTDSVYQGVNSFGKSALGAVKYAPIIPVPNGPGLSLNALKTIPGSTFNQLDSKTAGRGRAQAEGIVNWIRPDLANIDHAKELQEKIVQGIQESSTGQDVAKIIQSQLAAGSWHAW